MFSFADFIRFYHMSNSYRDLVLMMDPKSEFGEIWYDEDLVPF